MKLSEIKEITTNFILSRKNDDIEFRLSFSMYVSDRIDDAYNFAHEDTSLTCLGDYEVLEICKYLQTHMETSCRYELENKEGKEIAKAFKKLFIVQDALFLVRQKLEHEILGY